MRIKRVIVQVLAYTLYGLIAFIVFVYVTFPYDLLQQRLVDWFSREGVQLGLSKLRPAFPPGVQAEGIRVQLDPASGSEALLSIETLRVEPEWAALLSRQWQARFVAGLYGGRLEGDVRYSTGEGPALWDVKTRLVELEIAQYPLFRKDDKTLLRGRLSGDSSMTFSLDGAMQEGNITLRMQSVAFTGAPGWPFQLQRDIACDTLQGELKTSPKQGGIVSLKCQGEDLALDINGTVAWKAPLVESQLNMRGQVRSEEAYKQEVDLLAAFVRKRPDRRGELSFRLQGPLRQVRLGA